MPSNLLESFNVRITGNGSQPVIFAHGLGCDQNMWRFVAPAFEDQFKVVLFDFIGSGQSDLTKYDKEKYSSLQGYASDVADIVKELRLSDAIFVGHSVSSMIGLLSSIAQPRLFSRLVMIAPSPCYLNDGSYRGGFEPAEINQLLKAMEVDLEDWARMFAPQIMANPENPALAGELFESFCATDPVLTHRFATVTFYSDNRSDLDKLTISSLILQCSDDILAPPEVGAYLHKHTPFSTLRYLAAKGHCPHLSAPGETTAAIKAFLGTGR